MIDVEERARSASAAAAAASALVWPSAAKTARVGTATPGWTSTIGSGGMPATGVMLLADAARRSSGRETRHIGTSAPSLTPISASFAVAEVELPVAVEEPQRRRGVGRAAAEPGGDRDALGQRQLASAARLRGRPPRQFARRRGSTRLSPGSVASASVVGERSLDRRAACAPSADGAALTHVGESAKTTRLSIR